MFCPQVDTRNLFSLPPWSQGASLSPRLRSQMHWNEIPVGRRQQEWAGTRVTFGLGLGAAVTGASVAAVRAGQGQLCESRAGTALPEQVDNWFGNLTSSFKPESLTICELPNILNFHFCFYHGRFVLLFVAQNSEWQSDKCVRLKLCIVKILLGNSWCHT